MWTGKTGDWNTANTWGATDIAVWWIEEADCVWEASTPEDEPTHIYRLALLDFDYEMGYLLRVNNAPTHTYDYIAIYQRHCGAGEITVQWANMPHTFNDPERPSTSTVVSWWAAWVEGVQEYDSEQRALRH
jgi:hypothetical protein